MYVSKYRNNLTTQSEKLISQLIEDAANFNIEKLEELQQKNGITNSMLAQACGIDNATISRLKKDWGAAAPYTVRNIVLFFYMIENKI